MHKPCLLLTRPETANHRLLGQLDPALLAGAHVVQSPLLKIVATGQRPDLETPAGFILTSAQALSHLPPGEGRRAYCVGRHTAEQARADGWQVVLVAPDAQALVERLLADRPQGPLLHLCGVHRRGDIAARLTAAGLQTEVCALYDQQLLPLNTAAIAALEGQNPVILPLFSPRTAGHLADQLPDGAAPWVIAMSAAVAQAAGPALARRMTVVAEPTGAAMRHHIEKMLRQPSLLKAGRDGG